MAPHVRVRGQDRVPVGSPAELGAGPLLASRASPGAAGAQSEDRRGNPTSLMKEQSLGSPLLSSFQCSGPSGRFGRIIAVPLPKLLAGLLSEKDLPQLFQGRIQRLRIVGLRLAHARCLLLEAQDRLRRYGELTRHDFNQAPPKTLTNSLRRERRGTWSGSSVSTSQVA